MPEDTVVDDTVLDPNEGVDDAVLDDTTTDDSLSSEGAESDANISAEPGAEGDLDAEGKPKTGAEDSQQDGRSIPPYIRALKDTNPEAFKKAKTEFFDLRERRGVHATVAAAKAEHELVESIGGQQGVETLREENSYFKSASDQFLKGDPAFTAELFKEDPIAAALHVAPMLEQFRTADLEGYKTTIAKIWDNDFQQVGMGNGLANLVDAMNKKDYATAGEIIGSIQDWYKSITTLAQRAEDPRVKSLLAERSRNRETEAKTEQDRFNGEYKSQSNKAVYSQAGKVFDSFFKGRKLSIEDRRDLLNEVGRIADGAVMKDTEFLKQRDKHLANRDAVSANRVTTARYDRELTEAVKRVARRYGLVAGKPGQQRQPPGKQQQQQRQTPQGYIAVNKRPDETSVDWSVTSKSDILAGNATLLGGRKVSWAQLRKTA